MEQVQIEGKRNVTRKREYITKGYNLNEERFLRANKSDIEYFDELLLETMNIKSVNNK